MNRIKQNHDIIEDLQNRLSIVTQEKEAAVEMWKLAEIVASNVKEELKSQSSLGKVDAIKKEMESMQQDYSDAIKLLEYKVKTLEKELKICRNKNASLEEELENLNVKLSYLEEDKRELEFNFKRIKEEKDIMEKDFKQTQKKFDEATQVAVQARDKVKDALAMAQDALTNEANLLEEKERLERKISDSMDDFANRLEKEMDSVKFSLNSRIESLSNQLQVSITEKNQLSLDYESLKAEYNLKLQEATLKYNSLSQELQEIRNRRQSEISQWSEEREMLRKQVLSLQVEFENNIIQQRQKEAAQCENCTEMKMHLDKYRLLAKEWEDAAYCVTREFEKYNNEVQKLKTGHKCNT